MIEVLKPARDRCRSWASKHRALVSPYETAHLKNVIAERVNSQQYATRGNATPEYPGDKVSDHSYIFPYHSLKFPLPAARTYSRHEEETSRTMARDLICCGS